MPFAARRIGLLIRPHMDARMGANVQGPSLIRVPDWLPDPLGRYYLYFADHKGRYIRLAVADAIEGPWRMHEPGSLTLEDSLFPTVAPAEEPGTTPDRLAGTAPPGTPGVEDPDTDGRQPHIASPDVHVDHANRRIVMYYHGLEGWRTQRTRAATSPDGLRFSALPELLGPSYFRVFAHGGATYALAMPGLILRSADGMRGFERGPRLFLDGLQRHTAVLVRGDTLHVFWTRVTDAPERILHSTVSLAGDWRGWVAEGEAEVLRPETDYEGGHLPLEGSWRGAVHVPVRQLRDPCVFEEDGRLFLLYAVQGESGIALAELEER
ncbi:hypothetical protein G3576_03085 [Roseomonas stagni]|uniref:Uncharacterized protein n=1 Tax=Falsiroseomonas algicola TaxID=2716930 RepID=A0A6M1LG31_9PROT|nr:hypothetical protein [Falsiroseomonas algicola]NGM18984.1 hypothetical protein [Falsiroseomonas algicola]